MSRLSRTKLHEIALEETRNEAGLGSIDAIEVTPVMNHYGDEQLDIHLQGVPSENTRGYVEALLRATTRLRDRLLDLGEERFPIIRYGDLV